MPETAKSPRPSPSKSVIPAAPKELRDDPAFAAEYLKAAIEDSEEPRVLLIALRQLAKAQRIAKVARKAQIERESLYRALSPKGTPRFSTIMAITRALGQTLTVAPVRSTRRDPVTPRSGAGRPARAA